VLIEHFAGDFPLWLAPRQVIVLPITDAQNEYARGVLGQLKAADIRVELDDSSEKIGKKIREAELSKIPVMLIVGGKEAESASVAVRRRGQGDLGVQSVESVIAGLKAEIASRGVA
jgi:threonyl-tRNA synthetase